MLKDLSYEFVMTDNSASLITDEIVGYLEACIFETSKPIRFDVVLDDMPDVCIWSERNINGSHFIVIRHEAFKNSENKYNYQYEKFPLMNKLQFIFRGQKGTQVKIKVRYTDAR